jgi:hypothetical protein
LSTDTLWLIVALAAIVVASCAVVIAWATWRMAAEARLAAREGQQLSTVLRVELPATLKALERASDSLEQLAAESAGRLVTVDALAVESEATMVAVRELASSLNEIMRGPAGTVSGVRRSARMMGDGLAHGADRLRRAMVRDEGEGPTA